MQPESSSSAVLLLGPVEVAVNGVHHSVSGLRRRAALAALALQAGEVVSAERLIDAVWDDSAPHTAQNTLQCHISYLRREFGLRQAIVARAPGYVLELSEQATDLQVAEHLIRTSHAEPDRRRAASLLRQALDTWRGPSLMDLCDLASFSDVTRRLETLRYTAQRKLAETHLSLGECATAVGSFQELVACFPYDEDLHRQLMLALYYCGRQHDALSVYRTLRRRLSEELGVDPGPKLSDLERAILRHEIAPLPVEEPIEIVGVSRRPDTVAAVPASRDAASSSHTKGDLPSWGQGQLLEREDEVRLLDDLSGKLSDTLTGAVLLFEGHAGVGKTSLLGLARAKASAAGVAAITGTGIELERDHCWGYVRQMLEPLLREDGSLWATDGCRLAHDLLADATPVGTSSASPNYALLRSLYRVVSVLAHRKPLLVIADDLQWCDPQSAQFLAYLAARVSILPMAIVAAKGPENTESSDYLTAVFARVERSTVRMVPQLTVDGTVDMLAGLGQSELAYRDAKEFHTLTGGNPLLIREVASALTVSPTARYTDVVEGDGLLAVHRRVAAIVGRMRPRARAVLDALATHDEVTLGELVGMCSEPVEVVLAVLRELSQADLVSVVEGDRPCFRYPLIGLMLRESSAWR